MTVVEDRPKPMPQSERPGQPPAAPRPVPQGWGSHEERRLVLWGALGFLLLGLYAVGFVLVGQLVWS